MNDVESSKTSIPEARTWRDRVARAAAGETDDEPATILAAKRIVDRGLFTAILGVAALAVAGGVAGWTATTELMRPAETPVHAPLLLSTIILVPWLLLLFRWLVFRLIGARGGTILGRLVPFALVRGMGGGGQGDSPALGLAAGRQTARMLAHGSGRRMATAAGALFWVFYGLLAVVAIWLSTARVAYGFGWESSWLSPSIGRAATSVLSTPLSALSLGPDVESLVPVEPPPAAPADDANALATRREWIRFLSIGIGIYLVLPMGLLTIANAAVGHWRAEHWRPRPRPGETSRTTRSTTSPSPIVESTRSDSSTLPAGRVTHLATLEEPLSQRDLPSLLGDLEDLGSLDADGTPAVIARTVDDADGRILVIAMLSTTPDRGIRRLLDAVRTTGTTPLVMLDGGDALRRSEPPRTVAIRLADWKQLLQELGFDWFECDLSSATATSLRMLEGAMAGGVDEPTTKPPSSIEDIHQLDEAFAVIGAHLPDDGSTSVTLPSEEGLAACLLAVAGSFETATDGDSKWERRWQDVGRTLGHLSADPASRLAALRTFGLDVIPEPLRTGALWAGIGGVLGVAACAAAATVAPAALVAMPGWAGTAAGLAGLISLARRGPSSTATEESKEASEREEGSLGESVFVAATAAVLWWSQRGDEARTTRLLEILADDADSIPAMKDADSARLWLSGARTRLLGATGSRS